MIKITLFALLDADRSVRELENSSELLAWYSAYLQVGFHVMWAELAHLHNKARKEL